MCGGVSREGGGGEVRVVQAGMVVAGPRGCG